MAGGQLLVVRKGFSGAWILRRCIDGITKSVLLSGMTTSRVTVKGQVTVPKAMRDAFGWRPHTEVRFDLLPDGVKITRSDQPGTRGTRLVQRLRGKGNRKLSTDRIMDLTRGDAP